MLKRLIHSLNPISALVFIVCWHGLAAAAGPGHDSMPIEISLPLTAISFIFVAMSFFMKPAKDDKGTGLADMGYSMTALTMMTLFPITLFVQAFHGLNLEYVLAVAFWLIPAGFGAVFVIKEL